MLNEENVRTETANTTTETTEEKVKRTRQSPRTKALDEVLAVVDARLRDMKAEQEESEEGDVSIDNSIAIETLEIFRADVESLYQEKGAGVVYNGLHYIGVLQDGTREGFSAQGVPNRGSHAQYTSVLGPFRTKNGIAFRIANPDTACPTVF